MIGYPYAIDARIRDLPGTPASCMLAVGAGAGAGGPRPRRAARAAPARPPGSVLVVALALSVPVGEAIASAVGSNLFGTRNLAASWPAFALCASGVRDRRRAAGWASWRPRW